MKIIGFSIDVDDEPGIADSWTLTQDLAEASVVRGRSRQSAKVRDYHPHRRGLESA